MARRGAVGIMLVVLALVGSGCRSARQVAAGPASTAMPTTGRTAALATTAALSPCPPSTATSGKVPDVTLPCLGGGQPVRLARLGQPTVLNLWATWCRECAAELPVLAGVAKATHGRVVFVGVDTEDAPDKALQALIEAGVHYPNVYDRRSQVVRRLGLPGLPATVLVRGDGTVAYTKLGALASATELKTLMGTYLGVAA
ncbi:MAG: hypothetical protein DLM59_01740 [Pseudonocardiales bacterium]|nr:MAG: hypothetical protein DLM59_01740 [Pseudonocardiales bacterium]